MVTLARTQFNPQYVIDLRYRQGLYLGYVPTNIGDSIDVDDAQKLIMDDEVVTHSINLLSLQAIGEEVIVTSSNKQLEDILNFMLSNIESFSYARKTLVQTGTLFGLSLQRKIYSYKTIPGYDYKWKMVDKFQELDKKRLRLERDNENKNKIYWTLWCPNFDKYIILEDKSENPYATDEYSVQGYMWYVHNYEEDKPYFKGLSDAIYPSVYMRNKVKNYWADLCETWSGPMWVAKMNFDKASLDPYVVGTGSNTNDQYKTNMLSALSQMKNKKAIVIDSTDDLKAVEHGSTGNNIHREFLEYLDKRITLCILGTELASQSGKGGSYALGQVQENITLDTVKYARQRLAQTLKKELIEDFLIRNSNILNLIGINWQKESLSLIIRGKTAYTQPSELPYGVKDDKGLTDNVKV